MSRNERITLVVVACAILAFAPPSPRSGMLSHQPARVTFDAGAEAGSECTAEASVVGAVSRYTASQRTDAPMVLIPITPAAGRVEWCIAAAFKWEGVDWDEAEADAMLAICWLESRYDPTDQSPDSTAFGLWQMLDSTWADVGISKTNNPTLQTIAVVRYVRDRYGTPSAALEFHRTPHVVKGVVVHYY